MAWTELAAALAALAIAAQSIARRRALARYLDAMVESAGTVRSAKGLARCDVGLPIGPALIVLESTLPSYRTDGIGVLRAALSGTRVEHSSRLERRASALGLVAILITIALVAPLVVAPAQGLVVLAPWPR